MRGVSQSCSVRWWLRAYGGFGDGHRPWTHEDLALWGEWLASKGVLRYGAKRQLAAYTTTEYVTMERLDEIFEPAALEQLVEACSGNCRNLLEWWRRNLVTDFRARTQFPAEVAAKRGPQALVEKPLVTVGTIHSVKGGEADCSPPDEPVLTTQGYVPIGELDPAVHRLFSYTPHTNKIRRGIVRNAAKRNREGYAFRKACRPYCGDLLKVTTASSSTTITPNHHLLVRWAEDAKSKFVV